MTDIKGGVGSPTGGSGSSLSSDDWGSGISGGSLSNIGEIDLISGNQVSILGSGYSGIPDNSLTTEYQFANTPTITDRLTGTPSLLDMISNSPTTAELFANTPTITDRLAGTPSLLDMLSNSPTTAEQLANTPPLPGMEIDLSQPAHFDTSLYSNDDKRINTGHVQVCSQPAFGWAPVDHQWIKTSTKEAGMGGVEGNEPGNESGDYPGDPVEVTDHTGRSVQDGVTCEDAPPNINENLVNDQLEIGRGLGRWWPTNHCQSFVDQVIENATIDAITGARPQ